MDDLPTDPTESFPNSYTSFRIKCQNVVSRPLLKSARKGGLPPPSADDENEAIQTAKTFVPCLENDFKFGEEELKQFSKPDTRNEMVWKGGEKEGLARLDHFIQNALGHYSDTRNNLIGADYSSKLSPWISNGSLGIRFIYQQVFPSKNK